MIYIANNEEQKHVQIPDLKDRLANELANEEAIVLASLLSLPS